MTGAMRTACVVWALMASAAAASKAKPTCEERCKDDARVCTDICYDKGRRILGQCQDMCRHGEKYCADKCKARKGDGK